MDNYLACLPIMIFKNKVRAINYKNKVIKKGFNGILFEKDSNYCVYVCNQLNDFTLKALIKNLEYNGFNILK